MNTPISKPASLTSFSQLFGRNIEGHIIREVEIPLIQRDYAQGRKTENVNRIREVFIDKLCNALLPEAPAIDLDFVFGDVEDNEGENQGKFYPLDGQQRLTALFLLHCYLTWRTEGRSQDQPWRRFSYATRPEARDFCEFLVRVDPDCSEYPSVWITDHSDYLSTWQHDPSIQSMLVVLDSLHGWCAAKQPDLQKALARLVDKDSPAIRFHVLPMKANGLTDALYVKMNSRGKPLTTFENFKAHFGDLLKKAHPDKAAYFSDNVDTDWSNILWPFRGDDHLIDDEFMRYFRFITEVCAWKNEIDFKDNAYIDDLAERVYGDSTTITDDNLSFLFKAFDVWKGKDINEIFQKLLTSHPDGASNPLLIFDSFDKEGVNLFNACCQNYGVYRQWTLANTLFLLGVLLGYIHCVPDDNFLKRLRILRNLIEASSDEIRAGERNNMPKLLVEVEQVIVHGNFQQVITFNQVQVRNEIAKAAMLQTMPSLADDLYRLEDHDLLRGGLTVFDLEPSQFQNRSQAFIKIFNKSACSDNMPWRLITGALLAKGDYARRGNRWTGHRSLNFGAPRNDEPWRELFRGRKGESAHPASAPLMALLDAVAAGKTLHEEIASYLADANTPKDWRYYFVKYDAMREGTSGHYTICKDGGYMACMLNCYVMRSYYYDPYLLAAVKQSQINTNSISNVGWPCCFYGYETERRALILRNSGLQIQCVEQGWQLSEVPADPSLKTAFDQVCSTLNVGENFLYSVPQISGIDTDDRVILGGKLIAILVDNGF